MSEHLIKTIRFQERMLHELSNNSKKGDILEWRGISEKIVDLEYHKAKVLLAIRESNCFALREYIADCANILLSIGDEFGLYDSDVEALRIEAVLPEKIIQVREVDKSATKSFIPIF